MQKLRIEHFHERLRARYREGEKVQRPTAPNIKSNRDSQFIRILVQ